MHPPIDPAKLAAARLLHDCEAPTYALIAAAMGVNSTTLRDRASREKWTKRDFSTRAAVAARLAYQATSGGEDFDPATLSGGRQGPADAGIGGDANGEEPPPGQTPDGAAGEGADEEFDPLEMLARASSFVARQLGRIITAAERRGGRLDKSQIDGLVALSRMMERWESLAKERALKEWQKSDDERADTLGSLVDRLVQHSEAEAKRLVEVFLAAQPDGGAGWRVVGEGEA